MTNQWICDGCGGSEVVFITAKCADCFSVSTKDGDAIGYEFDFYDGDYIEFYICRHCNIIWTGRGGGK